MSSNSRLWELGRSAAIAASKRGKTKTLKREIGGTGDSKIRHPGSVGFKGSSEPQGARVQRRNK